MNQLFEPFTFIRFVFEVQTHPFRPIGESLIERSPSSIQMGQVQLGVVQIELGLVQMDVDTTLKVLSNYQTLVEKKFLKWEQIPFQ